MDENFKKFKKKVWIGILIKCISFGLAAGFLVVNAVLIPCTLYGINLLWILYALIALVGFALGGGIAFLIFRTDDKKIAKRLDKELDLDERVQTAYAFKNTQGEMLDLQRDDTSSVLAATPVKSLKFTGVVAFALSIAVAVTCIVAIPIVTSYVPPVYAQTDTGTKPEDKPRPVTDWEWEALDNLIEYVKASKKADAVAKTGMVTELEGLRSVLSNGVSASSLSMFVQNTVTGVRNAVKDANDRDISDEQKQLNSQEETYVVQKLYEIFSLQQPGGGDDDGNDDNKKDDNNNGNDNDTDFGWEVNINDVPFFDPDRGHVSVNEAREKYYERVNAALDDGTISREEWEYIIATYFADLSSKEQ